MGKRNFREMLRQRQEAVWSRVCVGLDPLPEKLPECIRKFHGDNWRGIVDWMNAIIDATAGYACLFKPQKAHYEALPEGQNILHNIVRHIHEKHPQVPVFLDCKRGDIGRTQQRYRIAHFEIDGVDGMNFNPYMGKSCMAELVDKASPGNAIVGLCRTSNPEAWEMQDILLPDGRRYWEFVAEKTWLWAEEFGIVENTGLVMGAAHKASLLNGHMHHLDASYGEDDIYFWHLSRGRKIVGDRLWYLIPGIGTQEGFVKETVQAADAGFGSFAINSSSGIIFASQGNDFAEAAGEAAKKLRDQINQYC